MSQFLCISVFFIAMHAAFIIIGFVDTSYTVDEAVEMLQVDVRVFSPPDNVNLPVRVIYLVIQTLPGSASKWSVSSTVLTIHNFNNC